MNETDSYVAADIYHKLNQVITLLTSCYESGNNVIPDEAIAFIARAEGDCEHARNLVVT